MPKLLTEIPKLCRHQRGHAFVKIAGQQIWLGRYGIDQRMAGEWPSSTPGRQVSRVRAMFRWAASHELLPADIYQQLRTVEPLRRGEAAERPKVKPVARHLIRAVRHRVSRQVRALMDLQLLTAARANELLQLRAKDIDRSRDVWGYNPAEHKTAHHEKERWIYFGPRAQKILKLFLTPNRPIDAYLFSPQDAEHERHLRAAVHRRANQKPNVKKTDRELGDRYTTASYRKADRFRLYRADRPVWSSGNPHRANRRASIDSVAAFLKSASAVEPRAPVLAVGWLHRICRGAA